MLSINKMLKGYIIQNRLINDTIYNHIEYTKLEDKILQTKILNRLQFITQNALAYFSFPSITTRRYIHSLGTMHLSSYMLKNAFLNARKEDKNSFLKNLKNALNSIIEEENLDISLNQSLAYFENKALFQFLIPTKNKAQKNTYIIILQALRLVGLLHDVGHLPFSHQVENALNKLYMKSTKNGEKEVLFRNIYEEITNNKEDVLHEGIGNILVDTLFDYELKNEKIANKAYLKLIHKIVKLILEEKEAYGFDFKVLHSLVSGTVDADRLDYINRDMVASGYIGGPNDHIRITKHTVLVKNNNKFEMSFFDMGLIDIEHMLEMRFNLYKKVIYNFSISKTDALLENVIYYVSRKYFKEENKEGAKISDNIAMLWTFHREKDEEKKLDIISMLDENWLISLLKQEYFDIKNKEILQQQDKKYLLCFEEILFGKRVFSSSWKNLNEFYKVLDFSTLERYKFRESFGYITPLRRIKLQDALDSFILKYENPSRFISYQIVSFSLGLSKDFKIFDGENLILLDEVSTLRKRLKQSMSNTVPFFLYINKKTITNKMKVELKKILFDIFI